VRVMGICCSWLGSRAAAPTAANACSSRTSIPDAPSVVWTAPYGRAAVGKTMAVAICAPLRLNLYASKKNFDAVLLQLNELFSQILGESWPTQPTPGSAPVLWDCNGTHG
jgi:hypothetical protein